MSAQNIWSRLVKKMKVLLKQLNIVKSLKQQSVEYSMPFWKLPDFILLVMGFANATVMIVTYVWASRFANDPREAVILVALEAILIMVIGNVFAESAKHMAQFNRLRKELIYIVSHQMRSPLTTIKWQVEMIKTGDKANLTERQLRYVDRIYEENEKLRTMISDILNMSRMEREGDSVVIVEAPLEEEILECVKMLGSYAEIKGIVIDVEFSGKNFLAKIDRDKIKIALLNLIENAISYSPDGGKIFISLKKAGKFAQIKIKDNGIGIDPSEQELIFQKFYRAENGRKKRPEGTGLGLFMTKKVVEQMDGKIKLKSQKGEGSEFVVSIPLSDKKVKSVL